MSEHQDERERRCRFGVTRRGFITSVGVGAVAVATAGKFSTANAAETGAIDSLHPVTLRINGRDQRLLVEPRWTLLHVIRDRLGLTGIKAGCERGECGACTVLIDNIPRYACLTLALEAEGTAVTTLEGLMQGEELAPVQQAFLEHDAFQCGYCTPGQIMAVEGLLRRNPNPSPGEIQRGVSGNLCRCGTYVNIFKAAERAANLKRRK